MSRITRPGVFQTFVTGRGESGRHRRITSIPMIAKKILISTAQTARSGKARCAAGAGGRWTEGFTPTSAAKSPTSFWDRCQSWLRPFPLLDPRCAFMKADRLASPAHALLRATEPGSARWKSWRKEAAFRERVQKPLIRARSGTRPGSARWFSKRSKWRIAFNGIISVFGIDGGARFAFAGGGRPGRTGLDGWFVRPDAVHKHQQ